MKKYYFIALFLVMIAFAANAQQEGRMSVGVDAGMPVGASANTYSLAIGGSLKVETPLAGANFFTLSLGYTSISSKQVNNIFGTVKPPAVAFIPLKLGLKYNLTGGLYAEAQIGGAFEIRGRRTTRFVYAPGLVYSFNDFDLGVRYEGWAGTGGPIQQAAIRLAYKL